MAKNNKTSILRIIDVNINRTSEALRVCEDVVRFAANDEQMTKRLKNLRHNLLTVSKKARQLASKSIDFRDPANDVGRQSLETELYRKDLLDIFLANSQRAKESLRVLEEITKLIEKKLAIEYKKLRFLVYEVEKDAAKQLENIEDD